MVTFRAGWLPTPPELPRPRFDAALRPRAVPASVDFYSAVSTIGFHLNDTWGDCTCACDANIVQGETSYGQGAEVVVPDSEVLAEYETTGFDPNAGPPGSNPTDQGWTVAAALAYLQATGLAGHKIAAYGQLQNLADHNSVMVCVAEFGYLSIGINLPNSAMSQFNSGPPAGQQYPVWDVVANDGGIDGGHCVCVCGYNATGPLLWTWGSVVQMTWAFWDKYVEEAWPVVSNDWVNAASGKDPEGVDLVTLGAEFQAVTGQNPFPGPNPTPTPSPSPSGCLPFGGVIRDLRYWSD